jgi:16S rRNA (guanine1516-N2)-methyltransferase
MDTGACLAYLFDEDGLKIMMAKDDLMMIQADFHGPTVSYRRREGGGRGQTIAKAVGLKGGLKPSVLDATAGLGGDAFVLASLGCSVRMLERVPAIRLLVADALKRGMHYASACEPQLMETLERLSLTECDSLATLSEIGREQRPDVVYLDPMFPERTKSAAVKKEMRVFHELVGKDADADGLLPLALEVALSRVVVKRPRLAAPLAGIEPSHSLRGKRSRFDVYIC